MAKDKFVVATWTSFSCAKVSETMSLREAYQLYQDSINETRIDQVVGVLDHKRRTLVHSWGNRRVTVTNQLQAQVH